MLHLYLETWSHLTRRRAVIPDTKVGLHEVLKERRPSVQAGHIGGEVMLIAVEGAHRTRDRGRRATSLGTPRRFVPVPLLPPRAARSNVVRCSLARYQPVWTATTERPSEAVYPLRLRSLPRGEIGLVGAGRRADAQRTPRMEQGREPAKAHDRVAVHASQGAAAVRLLGQGHAGGGLRLGPEN